MNLTQSLHADSANIAVGKQRLKPEGIWYTINSGIWQTVWLEPVSRSFLVVELLHSLLVEILHMWYSLS